MNHFLMAEMQFEKYQSSPFMQRLQVNEPGALASAYVDPKVAQKSYPLDAQEVATFKFLFNFSLDASVRENIVEKLFEENIGDQKSFARELYMNWEEIKQLQRAGMLVAWPYPLAQTTLHIERRGVEHGPLHFSKPS